MSGGTDMKIGKSDIGGIYKKYEDSKKLKEKKTEKADFSKVLNSEKPQKNAVSEKVERKDKIEISQETQELEFALNAAKSSEDIRQNVVDDIKQRIKDGTLDMDMDKIVDKMWNTGFIDSLLED